MVNEANSGLKAKHQIQKKARPNQLTASHVRNIFIAIILFNVSVHACAVISSGQVDASGVRGTVRGLHETFIRI